MSRPMPVISAFFGLVIRIFHADHNPPHIHAQYGEFEAIFEIKTGVLLRGRLPKRLERLLKEWLKLQKKDILRAWEQAQANKTPQKVRPLE